MGRLERAHLVPRLLRHLTQRQHVLPAVAFQATIRKRECAPLVPQANTKQLKIKLLAGLIVWSDISSKLHEQHVYCVRLANIKTKKINRVASPIAPWAIIFIQVFHAWFVP